MFLYKLPYSGLTFNIKPFLYKNLLDVSRLIYENNDDGLSQYLENTLDIKNLCIVDKFFVILKAKQLFIDDSINIESYGKNVRVDINNLLTPLFDIEKQTRVIKHNNVEVCFDLPHTLTTSTSEDIYLSTIRSVSVDGISIKMDNLTLKEKEKVISLIPASSIKTIRKFFSNTKHNHTIFKGIKNKIEKIEIDFFTNEPFLLIKNILNGYSLHYCREVIMYLSKKLSVDFIVNSTFNDVEFYIQEYQKEPSCNNNITL